MSEVAVYVPVAGSSAAARIDRGSGIVGTVYGPTVTVDFEGNRYGAVNMRTFADRVFHAWGRHDAHYPTVARMAVDAADVVQVGWFDPDTGAVEVEAAVPVLAGLDGELGYGYDPAALLADWLGVDELDPGELQRSNGR